MPSGVYNLVKSRAGAVKAKVQDSVKANVISEDQKEEMDLQAVAATIQEEIGNGYFNETASADLQEPEQNPDEQGLQGIMNWLTTTAGEKKNSFVKNFVENLPLRAQLLSVYLIENGTDISSLQSDRKKLSDTMTALQSYTPDRDKFVDKMTASKFKFWKYITGDQIDWDKYAKAARFARVAVEAEAQQAAQAEGSTSAADAQGAETVEAQGEETVEAQGAETVEARGEETVEAQGEETVEAQGAETVEAQGEETVEGLSEKQTEPAPVSPDQAVEQSTAESGSGQKVPSEARRPARPARDAVSDAVHFEGKKAGDTPKSILGYGSLATTILSGGAGVVGKAAGWLGNSSVGDAAGAFSNPVQAAGGVLSAAEKGVAVYQGIQDLKDGSYTKSEAAERGLNVGANALGVLKEGAGVAGHVAKTVGTFASSGSALASGAATAAQVAGTVGTVLGVGIGAINLAAGGVGLVSHVKHQKDIQAEMEQYRKRTDVSAEEKNQFEQISRVALVNERMAAVNSGFQAASGAASLAGGIATLTGVGAGIGGILAAIGTGISVVGKIVSAIAFRKRKKEAIDRFINLDKMVEKLKSNSTTKDMKIDEDKVRSAFIQTLGYISVDDMYEELMWQYANLMYENGVEGEDPAYIKLMANIGLKVDKKSGKPVPAQIAKKLKG